LEQQRTYDEKGEISPQVEGRVSKEIVLKELKNMFQNYETVQLIMDSDPNVEISKLVPRTLENGIICCL
jgi:hypothetical protein